MNKVNRQMALKDLYWMGGLLLIPIILIGIYGLSYGTFTCLAALMGLIILVGLRRARHSGAFRVFYRVIFIGYLAWAVSFTWIEYQVVSSVDFSTDRNAYDALIVLGAGLINGDEITYMLERRLDVAIEVHKKNPEAIIIVSGGQGPNERISEAEAMRQYLVDGGIEDKDVVLEAQSTSTAENMIYSKVILDRLFDGDEKIAIITNDYHTFRSNYLAWKMGIEADGISSRTKLSVRVNYMIREYYAVIKSYLLD